MRYFADPCRTLFSIVLCRSRISKPKQPFIERYHRPWRPGKVARIFSRPTHQEHSTNYVLGGEEGVRTWNDEM